MKSLRNKTLEPVKMHRLVPSVKSGMSGPMRLGLGKLGDLACMAALKVRHQDPVQVETEDMQSPTFWFKVWDVKPLLGCLV